jgi:4-methyl-5(b-hydroxyethyl)-thiazole monophosphate biosynthesis
VNKRVLVPIADGCEEMEAVVVIDTLRRAGAKVVVASVGQHQITASRGVKLVADCLLGECLNDTFDLIVLPGGIPGAEHLRDSKELIQLLARQVESGRLFGAICAAPAVVLQHHGFLVGRRATCHPSFQTQLADRSQVDSRVVVDGPCVTSQGPGTALEFALTLVALLWGEEKAKAVAAPMVVA